MSLTTYKPTARQQKSRAPKIDQLVEPPTTLFVYGSLRRGEYNNDRLRLDTNARYCGTTTLSGFRMFDLGFYPAVFPSGVDEDVIVADVYTHVEPETMNMITAMELGAGYNQMLLQHAVHGRGTLFVMNMIPSEVQVPGGDWVKYNTTKMNAKHQGKGSG